MRDTWRKYVLEVVRTKWGDLVEVGKSEGGFVMEEVGYNFPEGDCIDC